MRVYQECKFVPFSTMKEGDFFSRELEAAKDKIIEELSRNVNISIESIINDYKIGEVIFIEEPYYKELGDSVEIQQKFKGTHWEVFRLTLNTPKDFSIKLTPDNSVRGKNPHTLSFEIENIPEKTKEEISKEFNEKLEYIKNQIEILNNDIKNFNDYLKDTLIKEVHNIKSQLDSKNEKLDFLGIKKI